MKSSEDILKPSFHCSPYFYNCDTLLILNRDFWLVLSTPTNERFSLSTAFQILSTSHSQYTLWYGARESSLAQQRFFISASYAHAKCKLRRRRATPHSYCGRGAGKVYCFANSAFVVNFRYDPLSFATRYDCETVSGASLVSLGNR